MSPRVVDAPIRLALRVEGSWWVAYVADRDTMKDAREIGRIALAAVRGDALRERWKTLMGDVLRFELAEAGLTVARMDEQVAPMSERSGSA